MGVVGCGTISGIYLENCRDSSGVEILACADLIKERAEEKAAAYGVPRAYSVEELLADQEVEVVINLTVPSVHAEISLAALEAGKHLYSEKPLAIELEGGQRILDLAAEKGLRVGCAPDTFLGGGLQTCRKLIDDGAIGTPVAVTASMMGHGPEHWHPDPGFFYQPGAGPMFDMGPYYLTALTTLLGPVHRVAGSARATFPERTVTSEPSYGTRVEVSTPTHVAGVVDFEGGTVGTLVTSFDVWVAEWPKNQSFIEVYGTEGTLSLPDPNTFGGPVRTRPAGENEWTEVSMTHGDTKNSRGLGVADMARALRSGGEHRASGELGYHALEIIHAFLDSSSSGGHMQVESTFTRPAPLPPGRTETTFAD